MDREIQNTPFVRPTSAVELLREIHYWETGVVDEVKLIVQSPARFEDIELSGRRRAVARLSKRHVDDRGRHVGCCGSEHVN